eukprot:NODE_3405_length_401_cov_14.176136_g2866_i0.p4 GENE.NODE_3405_length_401_cov_14.176136_g2866_i0~~NODE_3405_length_401_cov_14.176136_g2866_i0.p4  ORF type:complete len:71 (-),score=5.34 NODE_3405_length_401_cov_14.176136_g2866_i0:47-259(-)
MAKKAIFSDFFLSARATAPGVRERPIWGLPDNMGHIPILSEGGHLAGSRRTGAGCRADWETWGEAAHNPL